MIAIDWIIIGLCLAVSLTTGSSVSKGGRSTSNFFLSGGKPLWCLVNASSKLLIVSAIEAQVIIGLLQKHDWNKFMKQQISIPV
ncbi:MAG TPA: hypothetical protein DG754_07835 [Bacteroidales bacterium]|jgi:hypothetical protein|nr:hypothetical protein [Bacteroidales bacterium]